MAAIARRATLAAVALERRLRETAYKAEKVDARPALADPALADWPTMGRTYEFLSQPNKADPFGNVHGRGTHKHIFVKVSQTRDRTDRSDKAKKLRDTKFRKHKEYIATGAWPWWVYHPAEATFHTDPRDVADAQLAGLMYCAINCCSTGAVRFPMLASLGRRPVH